MNPLDDLFADGSQPIRRNAQFAHKKNKDGAPVFEALYGDSVTLSPQGSIDSGHVVGFHHCGHPATAGIGGICNELGCQNISCPACYEGSRCQYCFAGCCLEHKHQILLEGVLCVVCPRCEHEIRRKQQLRALVRFVLAPFIEFKN